MIPRYTKPEIAEVWTDEAKFELWTESLLAVVWVLEQDSEIALGTYDRIAELLNFEVERVYELDRKFGHDAQALIENVRERLIANGIPESIAVLVGTKITSYDMEDPAFARMIGSAAKLILKAIDRAIAILKKRAFEHKNTLCPFLTHGQLATPGYLGIRICRWMNMLQRDRKRIETAAEEINVGKFSGATGIYDELDPWMEQAACNYLGLDVADGTSQIIHRDRHAWVMAALAICGRNIAQIANDLWEMCSYPRLEAKEYFSPNQRGSSAMPHKKNPVKTERLRGMPTLVQAYLSAALSQVMTWDERAIDQSSVERVIWPDATIVLHFLLVELADIFEKMIFYPERMKANLELAGDLWAAQYVKNALQMKGVTILCFNGETQPTYQWVQSCAFTAWDQETNQLVQPLKDVCLRQGIGEYLSQEEFERCFDLNWVLRNADAIYARYGI